jgi:hypothetical protein
MKRRKTLIDWQRLTLNLRSKGTLSSFAAEFGCDSMTLQRLARGDVEEPRFELGLKLLNARFVSGSTSPAFERQGESYRSWKRTIGMVVSLNNSSMLGAIRLKSCCDIFRDR